MLRAFLARQGARGKHGGVEIGSCAQCHFSHDPRWPQVGGSRGHRIHYEEHKIACVRCHAASMHGFEPIAERCAECHPGHAVRRPRDGGAALLRLPRVPRRRARAPPDAARLPALPHRAGHPRADEGARRADGDGLRDAATARTRPEGETLVACTRCHDARRRRARGLHGGRRPRALPRLPPAAHLGGGAVELPALPRARARPRAREVLRRVPLLRGRAAAAPPGGRRAVTLRLKLFVLIAAVIIFAMSGVTAVALWREVVRGQELLAREGVAHRLHRRDRRRPLGARRRHRSRAAPPRCPPCSSGSWRARRSTARGSSTTSGQGPRLRHAHRASPAPRASRPPSSSSPDSPLQSLGRLLRPEGIVASAPILRGGALVGAVRVDFTHEEVVGNARNLAWGASIVAAFWIFARPAPRRDLPPPGDAPARPARRGGRVARRGARRPAGGAGGARARRPRPRVQPHVARGSTTGARENQRLIAELEERVAQKTREVLRADRLATLGGIAAGFAHEIGNSLNVIRGYAAVAARELPADAPRRRATSRRSGAR